MFAFIQKAVQHCKQATCNYIFNNKVLESANSNDQYSAVRYDNNDSNDSNDSNGNNAICPHCDAEGRHSMTYEARVQQIKA